MPDDLRSQFPKVREVVAALQARGNIVVESGLALEGIAAQHGLRMFFDAAHAFGSLYEGAGVGARRGRAKRNGARLRIEEPLAFVS